MNLNIFAALCGLLALFALAGCPRDTGSTDGTEAAQQQMGGSQETGNAAANAAGAVKTGQGEEEAAGGEAGMETGEAETEGGEDMSESETTADGEAEEAEAGAEKGETPMSEEQEAGVTTVVLETTKGDIVVEVHNDWAPIGASHFLELVKDGYYDNTPFFRVLDGFVAQFGISANPAMQSKWGEKYLNDDPVVQGNRPGYLAYAMAGPNTRTTQIFINYADNSRLDGQGFACFGKVVSGMDVAQQLFKCEWPDQQGLSTPEGLDQFKQAYPKADFIKRAYIKE
jgi:peptidyl-prolyl cis-trans isomerase A (cyclophilin A)